VDISQLASDHEGDQTPVRYRERERGGVYVCVRVCVRESVCMCV